MVSGGQNLSVQEHEKMLHRYLRFYSPVRLFPILESKENLWYFIAHTCGLIAARVAEEQAKDATKGRPDAACLRGISWLDMLMWNELWQYPADALLLRTTRLYGIILKTSGLPRKPKDAHDPRRVALEYELLVEKFRSVIPRRPAKVNIRRTPEYREATFEGERGTFFRLLAIMRQEQRDAAWADKTLSLAQQEIHIPWWTKVRRFELTQPEILEFTPRDAALKVLAHFMQRGTDMVWALVKEGRKLSTSQAIEKLELAYQQRQHDPAACEFIECSHLLSHGNGQDSPGH